MKVTLAPSTLRGHLSIISSKSLSHRYVIAAGLAEGTSHLENILDADDLAYTKKALEAFNVKIDGKKITGGHFKKMNDTIDCGESGSTLRFMIPIGLLQKESITFTGRNRLVERPLDVYMDLFKTKRIKYSHPEQQSLPLTIQGKLRPGYYHVLGNVSSQFITGLLFALPLLEKDSVIEHTTPLESKGYIDLTLDVLTNFGIHVLYVEPYFYIKGNQKYTPGDFKIEGDFSQAAFWFVAGVMGEGLQLSNLNPQSKQGDASIIEVLRSMQAEITYDYQNHLYDVKPSQTHSTTIDLKDIPDLGPILMVLAGRSKGTTKFIHCERLKIKESDRLDAMVQTLTQLGVPVTLTEDGVEITGVNHFKGDIELDGFNDHRIVMAISIASIHADGPITILGAEAIHKSYPTFFEDFKKLGGVVHES